MPENEQDPKEQYANWKAPETNSSGVVDFAQRKAERMDRIQEGAELQRKKELFADTVRSGFKQVLDRRRQIDKVWEQKDQISFNSFRSANEEYYRTGEHFLAELLRLIETSADEQEIKELEITYLNHIKELEAGADEIAGHLGIPSKKTLDEIDKLPPDIASIIRASIDEANRK